jgi:hypothetical protein
MRGMVEVGIPLGPSSIWFPKDSWLGKESEVLLGGNHFPAKPLDSQKW